MIDAALCLIMFKEVIMGNISCCTSLEPIVQDLKAIRITLLSLLNKMGESKTTKLWIQHHNMVTIVKNFIKS